MSAHTYTRRPNGGLQALGVVLAAGAVAYGVEIMAVGVDLMAGIGWVLLCALAVMAFTMKVTLVVGEKGIRFAVLRFFRREIPYASIHSVTEGPRTGFWQGAGVRLLKDAVGYLVGGPTIRLESDMGTYVLSVEDPTAVIREITHRMGR